jgi:hypothetical protein
VVAVLVVGVMMTSSGDRSRGSGTTTTTIIIISHTFMQLFTQDFVSGVGVVSANNRIS